MQPGQDLGPCHTTHRSSLALLLLFLLTIMPAHSSPTTTVVDFDTTATVCKAPREPGSGPARPGPEAALFWKGGWKQVIPPVLALQLSPALQDRLSEVLNYTFHTPRSQLRKGFAYKCVQVCLWGLITWGRVCAV